MFSAAMNFEGNIVFDTSKSDGQFKKTVRIGEYECDQFIDTTSRVHFF